MTVPSTISEWSLGKGESAVLALALDRRATAILDDAAARRAAKALGVRVTGTFGVIVRAKRRGLIEAAKPLVRAVLEAGLYYDRTSVQDLLAALGETWP